MVKKPVFRSYPEARLQERLVKMLKNRGWFVKSTHGNAFQKGWPDLYAYNKLFESYKFGPSRWIDCKIKKNCNYTKAQCQEWPLWEAAGIGIWIIMESNDEWYSKLFEPPNFREFWKPRYDKYLIPIKDIVGELDDSK